MRRSVSIVKGTAVLTAAGFTVKVFGAVYRMYLSRKIGAEGMGLYQMAYPIYLIFLSLSTAGIPIAISKIVAEKLALEDVMGSQRVFQAALGLMFFLGALSSVGMALSAGWVATNIVSDSRAIYAIWALSPAIFLMSMMAVFRGYFQGHLNMGPSAYSQIFEQIVRVAVSLILAVFLLKSGLEHAAAGAAFGATAGGAAGLIYLIIVYWRDGPKTVKLKQKEKINCISSEIIRLIRFAIPISVTVILMPLLQSLDSIIVPNMLQKIGYTIKQSTAMLGVLGNSWAVIYLPLIVTGAIAANMVPAVASFKQENRHQLLGEKISEGFRLAVIYLIPAAIGVGFFGMSIYRIIYGQKGIAILSWFAPVILFLGLEQVSAGVLQGLGKPKWPLFTFLLGATVKVTVTVVMTGWPGLNLAGAAIGTICGAAITALLNFTKIKKMIDFKIARGWVVPLAGIGMFLGLRYLVELFQLPYLPEFLFAGCLGAVFYLVVLWSFGGINRNDLEIFTKVLKKKGAA